MLLDLDCSEIYKNTNDRYCVYLTGGLVWGHTGVFGGVIQGSCVYLTGIFGGVLQGSLVGFYWCLVVGSYRIIC